MNQLLSIIFPPKLPNIPEAIEKIDSPVDEIPESGIVARRPKQYKNGITRVRAERLATDIQTFVEWQQSEW